MSLDVEGRYIQTQGKLDQLRITYASCTGETTFVDALDAVEDSLADIKNDAVSSVSERMGGMYLTYLKQCATAVLPVETAETFTKDMDAVTAISSGSYFDPFDSEINSWLEAVHPLSCADMVTALNNLQTLINSKIDDISSLAADWVMMNVLQSDIGRAVALVIGIVAACGDAMYSTIAGLDNSILDEDSGLRKAVDSAKYAKGLSTDPTEIINLAKGKITSEENFDGRMTGIKNALISHTSSLLS